MLIRLLVFWMSLVFSSLALAAAPVVGQPEAPVAGVVLGKEVRTADAEELLFYVLRELTGRYAEQKGITVSPGEIARYRRHVDAFMRQDEAKRAARLVEVQLQLQDGELPETMHDALVSERDTLLSLQDSAAVRDPESAEEEAARKEIASAFIRQWKINQALYRQYGGRVIFQQGGLEPLDAYRQFLEDHQARGDFIIIAPLLEAGFWRYFRNDGMHSFMPAGSKEEAHAFATPPWAVR